MMLMAGSGAPPAGVTTVRLPRKGAEYDSLVFVVLEGGAMSEPSVSAVSCAVPSTMRNETVRPRVEVEDEERACARRRRARSSES